MADIDVERMKSIVLSAKKARGPDPRFVPPRRLTADNREVRKLLAPLLEKAALDPAALEPAVEPEDARPSAEAVADAARRHALMRASVVKTMKARVALQQGAAARPIVPANPPPITAFLQPFLILSEPAALLSGSNLAPDDNWARLSFQSGADYGGYYVSFWYYWTNPNDVPMGIDVDTSVGFVGYCSVKAGSFGGVSNAHISANMKILPADIQDGSGVTTPVIPVLNLHAESVFSGVFEAAPVNSTVDVSNDQVTVSGGATVIFEVFASFVFDNDDGAFGSNSYAVFDFDSGYEISNPGMTLIAAPWILVKSFRFFRVQGRAQKLMLVRRPTTNSFLIRCVGSSGLAIPMPGLIKY
jgi:hypothetical protein